MWIPVKAAVRRCLNNNTALQKGNNFSSEKELAKKYHVMSIPTVVVIKDGQLVDRSVGVKAKEELKAMIK